MLFMLYITWRYTDPIVYIITTCLTAPILILYAIILFIHYADQKGPKS
jgi:hypothetical protein